VPSTPGAIGQLLSPTPKGSTAAGAAPVWPSPKASSGVTGTAAAAGTSIPKPSPFGAVSDSFSMHMPGHDSISGDTKDNSIDWWLICRILQWKSFRPCPGKFYSPHGCQYAFYQLATQLGAPVLWEELGGELDSRGLPVINMPGSSGSSSSNMTPIVDVFGANSMSHLSTSSSSSGTSAATAAAAAAAAAGGAAAICTRRVTRAQTNAAQKTKVTPIEAACFLDRYLRGKRAAELRESVKIYERQMVRMDREITDITAGHHDERLELLCSRQATLPKTQREFGEELSTYPDITGRHPSHLQPRAPASVHMVSREEEIALRKRIAAATASALLASHNRLFADSDDEVVDDDEVVTADGDDANGADDTSKSSGAAAASTGTTDSTPSSSSTSTENRRSQRASRRAQSNSIASASSNSPPAVVDMRSVRFDLKRMAEVYTHNPTRTVDPGPDSTYALLSSTGDGKMPLSDILGSDALMSPAGSSPMNGGSSSLFPPSTPVGDSKGSAVGPGTTAAGSLSGTAPGSAQAPFGSSAASEAGSGSRTSGADANSVATPKRSSTKREATSSAGESSRSTKRIKLDVHAEAGSKGKGKGKGSGKASKQAGSTGTSAVNGGGTGGGTGAGTSAGAEAASHTSDPSTPSRAMRIKLEPINAEAASSSSSSNAAGGRRGSNASSISTPAASPSTRTSARKKGGRPRKSRARKEDTDTAEAESKSSSDVPSAQKPVDKSIMMGIWEQIWSHKDSEPFQVPVTDDDVPGYSDTIKNPMDLSTLKAKIEGGDLETGQEVYDLFNLIYSNCMTFNHPRTGVYSMARALSTKTIKLFSEAFPDSVDDFAPARKISASSRKSARAAPSSSPARSTRGRSGRRTRTRR
jgi:Bromodomain